MYSSKIAKCLVAAALLGFAPTAIFADNMPSGTTPKGTTPKGGMMRQGATTGNEHEELMRLREENRRLREENERLKAQLERMRGEKGNTGGTGPHGQRPAQGQKPTGGSTSTTTTR